MGLLWLRLDAILSCEHYIPDVRIIGLRPDLTIRLRVPETNKKSTAASYALGAFVELCYLDLVTGLRVKFLYGFGQCVS